jgi:hypothetical protein
MFGLTDRVDVLGFRGYPIRRHSLRVPPEMRKSAPLLNGFLLRQVGP